MNWTQDRFRSSVTMKRNGFVSSMFRHSPRDDVDEHPEDLSVNNLPPGAGLRTTPAVRPRIEGNRETEILDATLELLASTGYDRLTMDAVAAAAKASKATLYRRWSTKAELVVDAIDRAKQAPQVIDLDRGNLRDDLIAAACHEGGLTDASTMAVLAGTITALHRDQEFSDAFHERFIEPKVAKSRVIFERAQQRGEIPDDADLELLVPLLAAVVLHRAFILRLPVDDDTVARIVDEVVIPAAKHQKTHRTAPSTNIK
jgi:AcrR family transcriptional regulator